MPAANELEQIWFKAPNGESRCCPHWSYARPGQDQYIRTCKRRDCPRCGRPWAFSWETVVRENLSEYGGEVCLVTITAPGADRLPWACERKHQHAGHKGCQVEPHAADGWSNGATRNWQRLRDAARTACVRAGRPPALFVRSWEPQKRGVPHLHLVLGIGSGIERAAAHSFVDELAARAPEYGFGFVDRKIVPISAREAARYLSGYLVGRSGRKETIRKNIADPRMPRSLMWVSPALTRITQITMRRLRYVRWYFAARLGRITVYPRLFGDELFETAAAIARLERSKSPPGPMVTVTTRRESRTPRTLTVPVNLLAELRLMRRLEVAA